MSTPKIYGATLSNVAFGVRTFDEGIVQTEEIEKRVEDEKIIGPEGEKLGGAKYGPDEELNITYISNKETPTAFDLIGNNSKITFDSKEYELFNVREARSNTGFLTITARAEFSPDWAS